MSAIPHLRDVFTLGGTVQAGHGVYIRRRVDEDLLELCRAGTFAYILTARQMGKSSLMVATAERLKEEGIRSVAVDLTRIGAGRDVTVEQWYLGVLRFISKRLELSADVMAFWSARRDVSYVQRLTEFFEEIVLVEIASRVVIFIDEIDTTLRLSFTDDFFAAIRHLYNERSRIPALERLSFVLIGVATPSDLIANPEQTPFNIGCRVDVSDFTRNEANALLPGLGLGEAEGKRVLEWVLEWTSGHPYLTQRVCQMIALEQRSSWSRADVDEIVRAAFTGERSESDHNLQFVRDMLLDRSREIGSIEPAEVLLTYDRIRRGEEVPDEDRSVVLAHLKLSGIVVGREGVLRVRNRIYREAFDRRWVRDHLPPTWLTLRLRRTRKVALVATAGFLIVGVLAGIVYLQNTSLIAIQGRLKKTNDDLVRKRDDLGRSLVEQQKMVAERDATALAMRRALKERDATARKMQQALAVAAEALRREKISADEAKAEKIEATQRSELDRETADALATMLKDENEDAVVALNRMRQRYERRHDLAQVALMAMSVAEARYKASRESPGDSVALAAAIDAYRDAARQYERAGDRRMEAYAYLQVGGFSEKRHPKDAAEALWQASMLYGQLGKQLSATTYAERAAHALVRTLNQDKIDTELLNNVIHGLDEAIAYRKRQEPTGVSEQIALDYFAKGTLLLQTRDDAAIDALHAARDVYAYIGAVDREINLLVDSLQFIASVKTSEEVHRVCEAAERELKQRLNSAPASDRGLLQDGLGRICDILNGKDCVDHFEAALAALDSPSQLGARMQTYKHLAEFYEERKDENLSLKATVGQYAAFLELPYDQAEDSDGEITKALRQRYLDGRVERDAYFDAITADSHKQGKHDMEALEYCNWGLLLGVSNDLGKAAAVFETATSGCRSAHAGAVQARVATLIGQFYVHENLPSAAVPFLKMAADAYHVMGDAPAHARATERLAVAHERQLHWAEAAGSYTNAADLYARASLSEDEARARFAEGRSLAHIGNRRNALDAYEKALTFYRQRENVKAQRAVLKDLAVVQRKWGDDSGVLRTLKLMAALPESED